MSKSYITFGRIPSITTLGIISEKGLMKFKCSSETLKAKDFIDFIKELEEELKFSNDEMRNLYYDKRITIILDNSKLHTSKASIKVLKKSNFNFIFQPAYSPFYNSIENLWSLLKRSRRKHILMNK